MNFDIKEFVLDEKTIERQANLLSKVFKDKKKFNKFYLHWLYKKNPLGEAIGFDAYDNNRNLVAHYAAIQPNYYSKNSKMVFLKFSF